eukprot:Hpha_TRINITY_DN11795_c0_g2::TRINITY_DN11795_c0_g2_i1::g.31643::m.31643
MHLQRTTDFLEAEKPPQKQTQLYAACRVYIGVTFAAGVLLAIQWATCDAVGTREAEPFVVLVGLSLLAGIPPAVRAGLLQDTQKQSQKQISVSSEESVPGPVPLTHSGRSGLSGDFINGMAYTTSEGTSSRKTTTNKTIHNTQWDRCQTDSSKYPPVMTGSPRAAAGQPITSSIDSYDIDSGAVNVNPGNLPLDGVSNGHPKRRARPSKLKLSSHTSLGYLSKVGKEGSPSSGGLGSQWDSLRLKKKRQCPSPKGLGRVKSDVHDLCLRLNLTLLKCDDDCESVDSEEIAEFKAINGQSHILADRVGKGAFGTVYRCVHEEGRLCAAKMFHLPSLGTRQTRQTLFIEKKPGMKLGMELDSHGTVKEVVEGSPADQAGLVTGMCVVRVGDVPVVDLTRPPKATLDCFQGVEDCSNVCLEVVVRSKAKAFVRGVSIVHESIQEAVLLGRLQSDYITSFYTCALLPRRMVIIMELAASSLLALLHQCDFLPPAAVARYTRDMLCGLEYLHRNEVIHRDFKTANVLLGMKGNCKLTDFGCSKLVARHSGSCVSDSQDEASALRESIPSGLFGTPLYLAPEAARGEAGKKSDVWALGLVVAELLTGELPYENVPEQHWRLMTMIGQNQLLPMLPEDSPKPVADFLGMCWQISPQLRPTASALLREQFIDTAISVTGSGQCFSQLLMTASVVRRESCLSRETDFGWDDWMRQVTVREFAHTQSSLCESSLTHT